MLRQNDIALSMKLFIKAAESLLVISRNIRMRNMISRQNSIALFMCISRNLSRILSRTLYAGAGDKIEAFKQQSREATWSVRESRNFMLLKG